MEDGYLNLEFDIVGESQPQLAKVRHDMLVGDLITEIVREFDINDQDEYLLFRKGNDRPLDPRYPLSGQSVVDRDQLNFTRPALLQRKALSAGSSASLRLLTKSSAVYDLDWQPAIIGRPDADATHTSLLAVNLEWLGKRGKRVSRSHAQIVEERGVFYIESLAPNNPTFVNNSVLVTGERRELNNKDQILLKASKVRFEFLSPAPE
ncbi:MAG: FHA domain-containing protein [Candidatus Promineifilaceae bacterium]